ncbi:MAG: hypothetical protein EB009_00720 [Actinobacteria bacterium]|nr:hypothetical protein [Actinomycetota bacterium]NBP11692.1 hypothetical protein [Actinomycetota bacterium]NBP21903.1 hypothetical protein [Actinomycetota bacterium]NBP42625.1 hypothetical protein [Actinomycetota bacterium]NBQ66110.1 hypothetical protein [Actinomycetota bacterium]
MSETYIPGTCNLGKAEVRSRQVVAIIGFTVSLVLATGLIASSAPRASGLTLFAPLTVFAIGLIQSRRKFCLAYGLAGTFNLGKLGQISKVANPEDKAADRKTALLILAQAAALSLAITGAFTLLLLQ